MGASWSRTAFPDPSADKRARAARQLIPRSLLGAGEPREDPDAGMVRPPPVAEADEFLEMLMRPSGQAIPFRAPPPPPGASADVTRSDYESLLSASNPPRPPPTRAPEPEPAPRRHYGTFDTIFEQMDEEQEQLTGRGSLLGPR